MELLIEVLSWFFLGTGAFFMLVAGVGVLRMPDVFTRLHAAGVKDTLGAALTLIGLMLHGGFTLITVKLILIWAFLWFTSPVSSHSVARAALLGGVRPIIGRNGERPAPSRGDVTPEQAAPETP